MKKPKVGLLWKLTAVNIFIVSLFVLLSGTAIYNMACFLADRVGNLEGAQQIRFNSTLLQYLWMYSIGAIIIGSFIHYMMTKRMMRPVRNLAASMESLKEGKYPDLIQTSSMDEVGQLVSHFNDLIVRLKENEETRNKVITDMAHELRTPMSNINGYLEGMSKGVIKGSPELYHSLHLEAKRITSMIQQLYAIKEWDSFLEPTPLDREPADIKKLAVNCLGLFEWDLEQRGIKAEADIESRELMLHREGIQQVLTNLLQNAVQYYEGSAPIVVKGATREEHYELSVSGPGKLIAENDKEKVFERFHRTDASRSRQTGGAGLGLAISREIAERHNGELLLETDGQHHHFILKLPI